MFYVFNLIFHQFLAVTQSVIVVRTASDTYPYNYSADLLTDPSATIWKSRRLTNRPWSFWPDDRPDNRSDIPIVALTHSLSAEEAARRVVEALEAYFEKGFFMTTSPNKRIRYCYRFVDGHWKEIDWDTERKKVKYRSGRNTL